MDNEMNGDGQSYAFKYRIHDARIGRFLSLDPLAPDYPHNSPYAFSENRVIDGVELEGREYLPVGKVPVENISKNSDETYNFSLGKLEIKNSTMIEIDQQLYFQVPHSIFFNPQKNKYSKRGKSDNRIDSPVMSLKKYDVEKFKSNIWPLLMGSDFPSKQQGTLNQGCIGVTCSFLGVSQGSYPDLAIAYSTYGLALSKKTELEGSLPEGSNMNYAIFTMRFYSPFENSFNPDENGKVDMSSYRFNDDTFRYLRVDFNDQGAETGRFLLPPFDFGFFDSNGKLWGANESSDRGNMVIKYSTLFDFSKYQPYWNRQIFVVGETNNQATNQTKVEE